LWVVMNDERRVVVLMLGGAGLKWAVGHCGWFENDSNGQNAMRQYEFLCGFAPWDLARNNARFCNEANTGRIT